MKTRSSIFSHLYFLILAHSQTTYKIIKQTLQLKIIKPLAKCVSSDRLETICWKKSWNAECLGSAERAVGRECFRTVDTQIKYFVDCSEKYHLDSGKQVWLISSSDLSSYPNTYIPI